MPSDGRVQVLYRFLKLCCNKKAFIKMLTKRFPIRRVFSSYNHSGFEDDASAYEYRPARTTGWFKLKIQKFCIWFLKKNKCFRREFIFDKSVRFEEFHFNESNIVDAIKDQIEYMHELYIKKELDCIVIGSDVFNDLCDSSFTDKIRIDLCFGDNRVKLFGIKVIYLPHLLGAFVIPKI